MLINKKNLEFYYVVATVVIVFICDFLTILSNNGNFTLSFGTYLVAFLQYFCIFIFFRVKIKYGIKYVPIQILTLFTVWMLYLSIAILRGIYLANGYWDFKFLFLESIAFTLVAIVFYIGQNLILTKLIFDLYLKRIFLFGFLLIPLALVTNKELYARLMIPVGIFILFIPYVSKKWKLLILLVSITTLLVDITFRTNILKIGLSIGILSLFYFKNIINTFFVKIVWLSFFVIPLIFLGLGLTGEYNIFEETSGNEEYSTVNSKGEIESLSADTRTFLYQEVILDVFKSEAFLFGKSPSQGYASAYFFGAGGDRNSSIRYGSEVNILNIFLYFGFVGVVLFFLIVLWVSYLGIVKSKNRLSKMLGLLLASRFMLSFIEEFTQFDLNFYFFWIIVGLVSSTSFRQLTDKQIQLWLKHGSKYLEYLETEETIDNNN